LALLPFEEARSQPTNGDNCSLIERAVTPVQRAAAIVPDALLGDTDSALPCLIGVIRRLKPQASNDDFDDEVRARYLSATAAIRSILARLTAQDKANDNGELVKNFIANFRRLDDLDTVEVLTYGARNQNPDVRLNSLLILANIVDNTTVCVPLDHLFDPNLDRTDYGKKGRANLLAVVSVVAPWAYAENFQNINSARNFSADQIAGGQPAPDTQRIIKNVDDRLKSQTDRSNKSVRLPEQLARDCKAYRLKFAQPSQLKF
jgi:hypothetical protein